MSELRLQKFLAEAGVASRRKCEELMLQGRVEVNGVKITELGSKVDAGDIVKVDGKEVMQEEKKVYILLNKPVGLITTSKDQFSRKTVLDLIEGVKERIYPVGRLDYDTSGLLLLTNDGDLSYKLTHPSCETNKVYQAKIKGVLNDSAIQAFKTGIGIDGYTTSPARIKVLERTSTDSLIEVTIHEGKNRQVRRMFEAVGYSVIKLRRISIGPVKLGNLEEGAWRHLTPEEVKSLNKTV
ncbi:MAG: rRNA pseudouridine synthase [Ruminiclostridium sp.]|nr:rRNA pseudouridine synthase [Ruminiclostridium sp.]